MCCLHWSLTVQVGTSCYPIPTHIMKEDKMATCNNQADCALWIYLSTLCMIWWFASIGMSYVVHDTLWPGIVHQKFTQSLFYIVSPKARISHYASYILCLMFYRTFSDCWSAQSSCDTGLLSDGDVQFLLLPLICSASDCVLAVQTETAVTRRPSIPSVTTIPQSSLWQAMQLAMYLEAMQEYHGLQQLSTWLLPRHFFSGWRRQITQIIWNSLLWTQTLPYVLTLDMAHGLEIMVEKWHFPFFKARSQKQKTTSSLVRIWLLTLAKVIKRVARIIMHFTGATKIWQTSRCTQLKVSTWYNDFSFIPRHQRFSVASGSFPSLSSKFYPVLSPGLILTNCPLDQFFQSFSEGIQRWNIYNIHWYI